jgi:hypothetical protein
MIEGAPAHHGTDRTMNVASSETLPLRRIACARCGAAFDCGAGADHCWCADEAFRLPMPKAGEDCLCPACLRAAADAAAATGRRA